ncbi:uncharacterized protein N7459_009665 [Penicillium hispanicum]|uniref:uncharacterized protein n=1 Tax=Penicillium hispanicum TaxID=1080232 RepID=UPI002541B21E|nr:uncharacterized protein N7459_009665 [Penicillium hispanicum]KAJ5570235.1 hypothetical protein N7459_009665 [Penicillium hispanicum]
MPFLDRWPRWPEFSESDVPAEAEERMRSYKKQVLAEYGEASLRQAWMKTCERLKQVTEDLRAQASSVIPVLEYEELEHLKEETKQRMKDVGCFVIRGVVPKDEVTSQFTSLKEYIAANKDSISGTFGVDAPFSEDVHGRNTHTTPAWPEANPAVYRIFWTPTQQALRGHPRHLHVQKFLNGLWHDESHETSPDPLSYAGSLRIRPPGAEFYGLGPHIDAGSLCRWTDPSYRKDANQAAFQGSAHSTVLRTFQGWTALTAAKPREGSLLLYPYVSVAVSYLLLRPFFTPPDGGDVMDASQWSFSAENGWFPGTRQEDSQYLSRESHPHLRLEECLVYIPDMEPGDTIWWHCDMIHAVETEHSGQEDASVVYIAATPTTPTNIRYIKSQLQSYLAGSPLEDFPAGIDESKLAGYLGDQGFPSAEARKAMGYGL